MRLHATHHGLILALATLSVNGVVGQEKPAKPLAANEAVAKLLKTQLQSAQKAHRAAIDKMVVKQVGQFLVLANDNHPRPEEAYSWSVRWLHAQRDLSETKDTRIAAFTDHLKRMKDLKQTVHTLTAANAAVIAKGGLLPPSEADAAEWYLAEAELWLMKERAK